MKVLIRVAGMRPYVRGAISPCMPCIVYVVYGVGTKDLGEGRENGVIEGGPCVFSRLPTLIRDSDTRRIGHVVTLIRI